MAVTLDFQLDEHVLAEDRRSDPAAADPAVIETTYFTMPVRFSIDERELLQASSAVWLPQPLIGLAAHLLLSLDVLRSAGSATCSVAGAGTLRLDRRGERVHLSCSFNGVEAETSFAELEGAVKRFHERVKETLHVLVPELTRHPSWPSWFPSS